MTKGNLIGKKKKKHELQEMHKAKELLSNCNTETVFVMTLGVNRNFENFGQEIQEV